MIFRLQFVSGGSGRSPLDLGKPDLCGFSLFFEYIRIDKIMILKIMVSKTSIFSAA